MLAIGLPRRQLFADKKRQNEIVRAELCLADEISQAGAAAQTARAMNQFSHAAEAKRCASGSQARRGTDPSDWPDLTRSSVPDSA